MPDWRGALAYPFRGPERERPVVAAWVLLLLATVLPFLRFVSVLGLLASLIAVVPLLGYLVRFLLASEAGDPAPPLLADVPDLLRRGTGAFLVSFVYLIVPFVLLMITVYGAIYTDRVPDPDSFSSLTIYAGSTAVLTLSLAGGYLLPIALAAYGKTGRLRSAFSGATLRAVATNGAYFAGWVASFGLFGFTAALAAAIATGTRAGPVLATAIVAYALLLTVHAWGRSLARAR